MRKSEIRRLVDAAKAVCSRAYAPYSGFRVGAAVLTSGGDIYTGCNIENASYSMTMCAERAAMFNAVTNGHHDIIAIAVYTDTAAPIPPCGACRQVIHELGRGATVIMACPSERIDIKREDDLLPNGFTEDNLGKTVP